jgi:hypothetical protein
LEPATRCRGKGSLATGGLDRGTGTGILRAGSAGGATNLRGGGPGRRRDLRVDADERTGRRTKVLEGEGKATGGSTAGRETDLTAVRRKTPGSTPQGAKDEGGSAKLNEPIRRAVWVVKLSPGQVRATRLVRMHGASTRRYESIVEETQHSRRDKIGGLTTALGWVYGP